MHDTDTIIEELYTLDPSLREFGGDVRALVATLISAKPDVVVDQPFLDNLRRTLLARADAREEPTYTSISWWMVRLVPVGAIALIALTLLPTRQFSPLETTPTGQGGDTAPSIEMSSDAPFKTSAPSLMTGEEVNLPEPVVIRAVTVDVPSFIVVHVNAAGMLGEIVGVSDLLLAGRTENIHINLTRTISPSEILTGVFYEDDGDRFFTEYDSVKRSANTGAPASIPLNR